MADLRELYQQVILDHGRNPRNFCEMKNADHTHEGYNPLCGDRVTVYVSKKNNVINEISFQGSGCAISMAAASLMTEVLKGKTFLEAKELFHHFQQLVTGTPMDDSVDLGKLTVLSGVAEFPARVKCAILCWHTFKLACLGDSQ